MNPQEPQRPQHPLANYQFTADELRVFRECNTESFFQRSLPLGTTFGVAAFLGVKQGMLSPNVRYGAAPKVVVGVIVGYFLGKFSYQQKCAEKIMALPNSRLGEILRQRQQQRGGGFLNPDQSIGMGMTLGPFTPNANDVYSDEHLHPDSKGNALNLDTESRPQFAGLDDIYRPNLDSPVNTHIDADIPLEPLKPGMTYEELRKRNREDYLKKQQNPYSQPLPPEAPVVMRASPQRPPPAMQDDRSTKNMQTNKYGDAWSE
ncbi:OCIA domain-containing protein 1 [Stomoxys calcitrans]|uniref:OCIA domain-containing protein n=1 Tax=Stomoxys calcitrans TaxID=35570 RepID=A0A1I8Q3Z9_STOCA|nr:OCIA domain-containing protein 1 [Stomoxys calcitrans]